MVCYRSFTAVNICNFVLVSLSCRNQFDSFLSVFLVYVRGTLCYSILCADEMAGVGTQRKDHNVALVATHILDVLDMVDMMTTNQQHESVSIECIAQSLHMSLKELSQYLAILTRQGKIEWCNECGQNTLRLSPDGYVTLQDIQDARRKRWAIAHNA